MERTVTVEPDIQYGFTPDKLENGENGKRKRKPRNKRGANVPSSELGSNDDLIDRVELNEKNFPDGSRQVNEVTYYKDGTKSINTKRYAPGE